MFVLCHLALEKPASEQSPFAYALRREHVDLTKPVLALAKVLQLDPALVEQRLEPAGNDTQLFGDLAMGHVGVALQHAHTLKVVSF